MTGCPITYEVVEHMYKLVAEDATVQTTSTWARFLLHQQK